MYNVIGDYQMKSILWFRWFHLNVLIKYNWFHVKWRGSRWLGIGRDPTGTWSKEGTLIQISDVVEDTSDFDFDAAEYFDMSSTGDWNYEFDVSDSDNITGLRHNLKRHHTKISI